MRPPRYRFPDEVRSTTRAIASRMVDGDAIARSPDDLDDWLAGNPAARESLEKGGYGTEFTAGDLFPLLEVFIVQAGGPPPVAEEPEREARRGPTLWLVVAGGLLLLIALGMILF